ncbi:hypothetical protein KY359_00400 [Candidatus Woesearchaeota archaeon]|nr:hypothetical protein [Candidatus Woesearchaeota archaeon]
MEIRRQGGRVAIRFGKKAFITDVIVDFWAYIVFTLVIIVFAILYVYTAKAKTQELQDARDITYGNYLAQVYLRKPITVGGAQMTMAELIALYDYNQTLELQRELEEDRGIFESMTAFFQGTQNPMRDAIMEITDAFVRVNFEGGRCYVFAVHGNAFNYLRFGDNCLKWRDRGFFLHPEPHLLLERMPELPNSSYINYISPIDPRNDPILIYSIYDMDRLIDVYAED